MDWTSKKIMDTVENLRKDSCYKNGDELVGIYGEFRDQFPKLFYTCLEPDFNMQELGNLLKIRDNATKENTPDIVRDTTVGEFYAKRYVYPVTGEPTLEEKKKATKKVAKRYVDMELN